MWIALAFVAGMIVGALLVVGLVLALGHAARDESTDDR
jgi:hypothetical protein